MGTYGADFVDVDHDDGARADEALFGWEDGIVFGGAEFVGGAWGQDK